jgi:hypothetical protein
MMVFGEDILLSKEPGGIHHNFLVLIHSLQILPSNQQTSVPPLNVSVLYL